MKKKFSTHWVGSRQPRKQRKYVANAPLHIRHDFISAHLSKELRKKYSRRNFPVRKDDEIKIMKGDFRGKKGKIEEVDTKNSRVVISGIYRTKKDGTKVKVYFHTSNLLILELNLNDKKRMKAIAKERKIEEKKTEEKKMKNKTKKEAEKNVSTKK
jgi:large subunit ribosomal protein L24